MPKLNWSVLQLNRQNYIGRAVGLKLYQSLLGKYPNLNPAVLNSELAMLGSNWAGPDLNRASSNCWRSRKGVPGVLSTHVTHVVTLYDHVKQPHSSAKKLHVEKAARGVCVCVCVHVDVSQYILEGSKQKHVEAGCQIHPPCCHSS